LEYEEACFEWLVLLSATELIGNALLERWRNPVQSWGMLWKQWPGSHLSVAGFVTERGSSIENIIGKDTNNKALRQVSS
jgi:hypothetical protein